MGEKWSSKLLFQFKGPYRTVKVHRTAVHLKSLSGQPESTQNLRNVYPYHCHVDDMIDNFDRALLTRVEQNTTSLDLEGHMVIVDLSDSHGLDFRVARLVNKIDDDQFVIHYYDSPSKADLSKRPFYPAYSYTAGNLEDHGDLYFDRVHSRVHLKVPFLWKAHLNLMKFYLSRFI